MSHNFEILFAYMRRVPAIQQWDSFGSGIFEDGNWWVKFGISIEHPLAWQMVQEFGYVLNYVSLEEPLPTLFKPVSPPPYMNGGPKAYLSWVIESTSPEFTPTLAAEWLEGRLPRPVEDINQWVPIDAEDHEEAEHT
jgi:hypothetical protein